MVEANNDRPLIGYITSIQGNGMKARLLDESEGFEPVVTVDGKEVLVGQLGSYVSIRQGDINLLALITQQSEERVLTNGADAAANGGKDRLHRYVSLSPLGQLDEKGVFRRGVQSFPVTGAGVYAVGTDDVRIIFADFYQYGFNVGNLSAHPDLEVCFNPAPMFGRHFTILGQSGSGKSWTVASLIQRTIATMPNAHILLLDLHGEYYWTDQEGKVYSPFPSDGVRYMDSTELELPYWLMSFSELLDLLIDPTEDNTSVQISFLRDTVLNLKKAANKDLDLKQLSVDTPVYFSIVELFKQFKAANEHRTDFGKTKGQYFGQFDKFLIRLHSRLTDVRYNFLLRPSRYTSSAAMAELLGEFVGLGENQKPITIIDMSTIPVDVRPVVSAQLARLIFEFNFWNPRYQEFPILLVCEEAHSYIPRQSKSEFAGTRRAMERIAKEGRKYGVALGVISQRPSDLSETVLAQCGSFLCMRISDPEDQEYIGGLVPDGESNLLDMLSALGRGEMLVLGEAVPLPTRVQIYKPDPPPKSNDVDYYTHWKAKPEKLDVAAIVDRWRRQDRSGY